MSVVPATVVPQQDDDAIIQALSPQVFSTPARTTPVIVSPQVTSDVVFVESARPLTVRSPAVVQQSVRASPLVVSQTAPVSSSIRSTPVRTTIPTTPLHSNTGARLVTPAVVRQETVLAEPIIVETETTVEEPYVETETFVPTLVQTVSDTDGSGSVYRSPFRVTETRLPTPMPTSVRATSVRATPVDTPVRVVTPAQSTTVRVATPVVRSVATPVVTTTPVVRGVATPAVRTMPVTIPVRTVTSVVRTPARLPADIQDSGSEITPRPSPATAAPRPRTPNPTPRPRTPARQTPGRPMTSMCVGDILANWNPVKKTSSASESVLVFGELKPGVFPNLADRKVVVKMSPFQENSADNSLEVERKMYMRMKDEVRDLTPHVLEGVYYGSCTDAAILNLKDSENEPEFTLYEEWITLRRAYIFSHMSAEQKAIVTERLKARFPGKEATFFRVLKVAPELFDESKPMRLEFIVTPWLTDKPMTDFLSKPVHMLSQCTGMPEAEVLKVAGQVAQCLIVLGSKGIMHHDLHTGNIFLRRVAGGGPQEITYNFPLPTDGFRVNYSITSHYFATVYDWDHSSSPELFNGTIEAKFCESVGHCNYYVKNFDWYTFVTYYIEDLKRGGLPVPQLLRDVLGANSSAQDAWVGRPCTCKEGSKGKCLRCELKVQFLENMCDCIV